MKTEDGGQNWNIIVDSNVNWRDIHFSDSLFGWVVGRAKMMKTIDGGQTWIDQEIFAHYYNKIFFINREKGWLHGHLGSGGATWHQEDIWYTIDGGLNWSRQYLPINWIAGFCFADENNGWAIGGNAILHTNNGGVSKIIDNEIIKPELNSFLYPNPARNQVYLSLEGHVMEEVAIYTLSGQLIIKERPVNGIIDISSLRSGMYIVEVTVENTRIRQKLLVQR